jgi:medium-chain acyl-[acyl-carrier-protein] hydrolase
MTRLSELVETLVPLITPLLDRPFAFFGHSLGALIAFELARELQRRAQLSPTCLFASAARAPQLPARNPPIYGLPREEFIAALSELNGTPDAIWQNKELLALLLPMLRADMSMFDTYTYLPGPPLACPILAIGGLQDTVVLPEELHGWRRQTRSVFSLRMFPGDHFFLQSSWKPLLEVISRTLASASW